MNQGKNRGLKINISIGWERFWGIFQVCLPTLELIRRRWYVDLDRFNASAPLV